MSEILEYYQKECVPQLMQEFGYKNINEVPKLDKIVLNMVGVQIIQPGAIETLKMLCGMASNLGIELILVNINSELAEQISRIDYSSQLTICKLPQTSFLPTTLCTY